jgi:hypothetical protein
MSFLKKLGLKVLQVSGIVAGILPLVKTVAPTTGKIGEALDKLEASVHAVFASEVMLGAIGLAQSGSQKAKAAAPYIAQLILSLDALDGRKLSKAKEPVFRAACERLAGNLADALNCFEE